MKHETPTNYLQSILIHVVTSAIKTTGLRTTLLLINRSSSYFSYLTNRSNHLLFQATFKYIFSKNVESATNGIISPDALKRRHRRHGANIKVTFLSVVAQFLTNVAVVVFLNKIYGKNPFFHRLFAIIHAG